MAERATLPPEPPELSVVLMRAPRMHPAGTVYRRYGGPPGSQRQGWCQPGADLTAKPVTWAQLHKLGEVTPLVERSAILREYADRWHYVDHTRWPMSTFGAAPTPYCACGKTWPEGGCTERRNLIADAATPLPPAGDEFNAKVAQALRQLDGSTASAVALLTGMSRDEIDQFGGVGSKPINPDVDMAEADRLWAEIENGPPMPGGWCTWHQMVDCAGDAPECREARAEIVGQSTEGVLREVVDEMARQDAKWGIQNHPDGTGQWVHELTAAALARESCQKAAAAGEVTWRHILREEVYEALAESDPAKLRAELVQVAAVAAAWVEAIDRRAA